MRNRNLSLQPRALADCLFRSSLFDNYRSKYPPRRTSARLVATEDVTHDIREFRFELADPNPFLPGQYALLYLPGVTGARAYSMCNVTADGVRWDFQIKNDIGK